MSRHGAAAMSFGTSMKTRSFCMQKNRQERQNQPPGPRSVPVTTPAEKGPRIVAAPGAINSVMSTTLTCGTYKADNANLSGSEFHKVNLSGSRYTDVNLRDTVFENVALTRSRIRNA